MSDSIPQINGMNKIIDDTISLQMESIGTQSTTAAMGNQVTSNNQALASAWNSCDESQGPTGTTGQPGYSPGDPAYVAWYYLQLAQQGNTDAPAPPTGPAPALPNGSEPPASAYSSVDNWVQYFLGGTSSGIPESSMSSFFLVEVYNAYMNSNPSSTDIHLGLINSVSSWITSDSASDEKSGQNEITLTNTLSQHFISDQSPLSNIGSSVVDTANNYAAAMQAISA